MDSAEKQCQLRGTRLTQKRKTVLRGLVKSKHAMTAYELAGHCKEALGESIPAMSDSRVSGKRKPGTQIETCESLRCVHTILNELACLQYKYAEFAKNKIPEGIIYETG